MTVSFSAVAVATLIAILVLFIWRFVDSSFSSALDLSLICMRLRPHPGVNISQYFKMNKLGLRCLLLTSLLAVTIILLVLSLYKSAESSNYILILCGIGLTVAGYFALVFTRDLNFLGLYIRVYIRRHEFVRLAKFLLRGWPHESKKILVGKKEYGIIVDSDYPNIISIEKADKSFPFSESVGEMARRVNTPMGRVCMDLASVGDFMIDYLPGGEYPTSFSENYSDFSIQRRVIGSTQIGSSLFLTRYSTWTDLFGDEIEV